MRQYLHDVSERAYRRHGLLLLGLVLLFSGLIWLKGVPILKVWGHDIFIPLDGAWRILQGQVPHRDFYSPFGLLNFLLIAAGMALTSPSPGALFLSSMLVSVLVAVWVWAICRARAHPIIAFVLALYAALVVAGECTLGQSFTETSTVSILNRFASGFLIVFISATLFGGARPEPARARLRFEGFSAGLLLVAFFVLKLNYFGFAVPIVLAVLALRLKPRGWWIAFGGGAALGSLAIALYLGFDFAPMLRDFGSAIGAKLAGTAKEVGTSGTLMERLTHPFAHEMTVVNFLAVMLHQYGELIAIAVLFALARPRLSSPERRRVGAVVILLVLGGVGMTLGNFQIAEVTGLICAAALLFETILGLDALSPAALAGGALCLLVAVGPWIFNNAASIVYAALFRPREIQRLEPTKYRFDVPSLHELLIMKNTDACAEPYAERVNEGIRLLASNGFAKPKIAVLDFANPFTVGLGLPSPRHGVTNFSLPLTFDVGAVPAEELFSDTDIIMIPKCPDLPYATSRLVQAYGGFIGRAFPRTKESRYWVVITRPLPLSR